MIGRWLFSLFATLALAACEDAGGPQDREPPAPALWEIASPDGTVEGWLFGTIHALPDDVEWRTPALQDAVKDAELLVVEIAALEDRAAIGRIFGELGTTPGQPSLFLRVSRSQHDALRELLDEGGFAPHDFSDIESWAAALTLAQIGRVSEAENGVDRALLQEFQGRPVVELEGAAKQLAIFDRLPESDQRALLGAVIEQTGERLEDPLRLMRAWRAGDIDTLANENRSGMMRDPELREALLVARNREWVTRIAQLLPAPDQPFVAVGAAHMAGPEGLPALLAEAGYRVTRIQ